MVEQYKSMMWTQHIQVSIDIDWFKLEPETANQPIFVLDKDPELCAQSLTTEHIKQYIDYIVYSTIMFRASETIQKKSGAYNKPRVDYMYYNQRTAYWFFTLYAKMQEIYKKRFGTAYKVSPYFNVDWINRVKGIRGPMEVKHKAHKGVRLPRFEAIHEKYSYYLEPYKKTIDKVNVGVPKFRVMYMLMGYLYSEFPLGAPAWYNNMKATIWKSYNKMTRLYYRIDTNIDGVYSYYYSADDKHWTEIKNIPMELRGLIDGIIFAREV